jgi:hypothetical protein
MISFIGERAARQQRDRLFSVYRIEVLVVRNTDCEIKLGKWSKQAIHPSAL